LIFSSTFRIFLISSLKFNTMKLPELRIGNYFEIQSAYEETGSIEKITEIGKKQVHTEGKWVRLDDLISISITEEILLHIGFTQFNWLKDSSVFECSYFKCRLDDNGVNLFCDNLKNIKPVKHLHELQNLYFDLTGEELAIDFNYIKSLKIQTA